MAKSRKEACSDDSKDTSYRAPSHSSNSLGCENPQGFALLSLANTLRCLKADTRVSHLEHFRHAILGYNRQNIEVKVQN